VGTENGPLRLSSGGKLNHHPSSGKNQGKLRANQPQLPLLFPILFQYETYVVVSRLPSRMLPPSVYESPAGLTLITLCGSPDTPTKLAIRPGEPLVEPRLHSGSGDLDSR